MSGSIRPITCCDRDCAFVNWCHSGGYQCPKCGRWFCGGAMDGETGLCYECAEKAKKEADDGE